MKTQLPLMPVTSEAPGLAVPAIIGISVAARLILALLVDVVPVSDPGVYDIFARNCALFDQCVLISTNFGTNSWMGNNPDSTGRYQHLPDGREFASEIERSEHYSALAKEYIRQDPIAFLQRSASKAAYLYSRETIGVAWNEPALKQSFGEAAIAPLKVVSTLYFYGVLGLALAGIALLFFHMGAGAFLASPILVLAYFTAVHSVVFVSDRFHIPLDPILALLAAVTAVKALDWARTGRRSRVTKG